LAADRKAARLKAARIPDSDIHLFVAPGHPKQGGLIAVYPGRNPKYKAILLLAHLDVVEANRQDWTRDPFTLVEEKGNLYARGALDDKAQAAMWVDILVRFREEDYRPLHAVKLALTCGEETTTAFKRRRVARTEPARSHRRRIWGRLVFRAETDGRKCGES
jgi:acetylornithine deacetylase/succinyl-diaminopimelate desuccinylase-like protein